MKNNNEKIKVPLASSSRRIFCRIIDLLICFILIVLSFLALFPSTFSNKFVFISSNFFWWTIIICIIHFLLFIIIPFITNGRTLMMFPFKLRIYNLGTKSFFLVDFFYLKLFKIFNKRKNKFINDFRPKINFLFNLFIREFLLSTIYCFINIILGIVIISLGDNNGLKFIKSLILLSINNNKIDSSYAEYAIVFFSLYSISFLVNFVLLINVIINSCRMNFIDFKSNTATIHLVNKTKDDKENINLNKKNNLIKYNFPGIIDIKEVECKDDR